MRSRRILISGVAATALLASFLPATAAPPKPPAVIAPANIAVINQRDVCIMPAANNNGRVLGYDAGWSLDAGTNVYFFFGDTYSDRNGDGVYVLPNGVDIDLRDFTTGTVARTTDRTADDCLELTYKTDAVTAKPRLYAVPAIPPDVDEVSAPDTDGAKNDECLTWPESGIKRASDGKIFINYTSVRCVGKDADGKDIHLYEVGLAEMTDTTNMIFERKGILWEGSGPQYGGLMKIGTKVYSFAFVNNALKIKRVDENFITDKTKYTSPASQWTFNSPAGTNPSATPSIAFNSTLNRFVAVYTCALATKVCARVASTEGETDSALRGAWNPAIVLRECVAYPACAAAAQHPAYARGSTIYVTTNRHDGAYKTTVPRPEYRYQNTLREYDLSMTASKPAKRGFGDSELAFGFEVVIDPNTEPATKQAFSLQGPVFDPAAGWYYSRILKDTPTSYVNADANRLVFGRSIYSTRPVTNLDKWFSWVVDPNASGIAAPRVFADGAAPSPTHDAVRVLKFFKAGRVALSVDTRLLKICSGSDGVTVDVAQFNSVDGWRAGAYRNLDPGWIQARGWNYKQTFDIKAGDKIVFRIKSRSNAACDSTMFFASYTYDKA